MTNTLIVRCDNESSFSVNGTKEKILAFTKWANEYHHGTFDGINTINCNKPIDLLTCKQKARREGLLACVSKEEIRVRRLTQL